MYRSSRFLLLNRETLRRPLISNARQLFTTPPSQDQQANTETTNNSSASYVNETYESWRNDPSSVHKAWDDYFKTSSGQNQQQVSLTTTTPDISQLIKLLQQQALQNQPGPFSSMVSHSPKDQLINDHLKVHALIRSYQIKGHKMSNLDPLGIGRSIHAHDDNFQDLSHEFYNFTEADLSRRFKLPSMTHICGTDDTLTLEEILKRLKRIYTRSIGVEYMHINDPEKRDWIRQQFEWPGAGELTAEEKKRTLKRLIRASKFEEFLAKKWTAEKRFGLEGCDMLIPAMKTVIDTVSARGVDTIIMGMPHRGRLNVLANVTRKPLEEIFNEFDSKLGAGEEGSGDVKYHLGTSTERINRVTNAKVKMVIVANPSHLEAVDPVVVGKTRSEQFYRDDKKGEKVMGMMIHGDAAFSGQGVVFETFHLSDLPAYTTHGTVHIVANNQIGFTTDPRFSRSSPYCTDVARVVYAPIFHVNADDPEAVIHVCRVAAEWRCKFKKDVVIDLVSYRKNGHNEVDEPKFTNPYMYKAIEKMVPLKKKYAKMLIDNKVVEKDWYEAELKKYETILEDAYNNSKNDTYSKEKLWIDSPWKKFFKGHGPMTYPDTGISEETILKIAAKFSQIPTDEGFEIHKNLKRILAVRSKNITKRTADWAMGEAFAFGSLLIEGTHVRLSGQDVERGTFSHRHHVLHNQAKDLDTKIPLNELWPNQAHYTVCNSSLSEYAVLGFELGYSLTNPNALIMWEAQFGDFANGAQIIIDQFLASGQAKWTRQTGLVLLLPHGYDGMGPEHSSARLERFLQLIDEDHNKMPSDENTAMNQLQEINMIVANPTTPANYMHLLRRQIKLPFRKPLIVMTPKALLKEVHSSFDEMLPGTSFMRVYKETGTASNQPEQVKKVLFCSGKVFYDLVEERKARNLEDQIAIVRIEQIAPFPFDLIKEELCKYKNAKVCFVQEEHKNAGAYEFARVRMQTILRSMNDPRVNQISYAGRETAAATATGNKATHKKELKKFLDDSMSL